MKLCQQVVDLSPKVSTSCALEINHEGGHCPEMPINNHSRLLFKWWKENRPTELSKWMKTLTEELSQL